MQWGNLMKTILSPLTLSWQEMINEEQYDRDSTEAKHERVIERNNKSRLEILEKIFT